MPIRLLINAGQLYNVELMMHSREILHDCVSHMLTAALAAAAVAEVNADICTSPRSPWLLHWCEDAHCLDLMTSSLKHIVQAVPLWCVIMAYLSFLWLLLHVCFSFCCGALL